MSTRRVPLGQGSAEADHLRVLDLLRAIAALSVVLFHFGASWLPTLKPHPFHDVLVHGRHGVDVFFVISGLVLPLSMTRSRYTLRHLHRFLLRRCLRVVPPAWAVLVLWISLFLLAERVLGRPIAGASWPGTSAEALLANFAFLCDLTGPRWYVDVYWTLGVELQFYLAIGLVYPLLARSRWGVLGVLASWVALQVAWHAWPDAPRAFPAYGSLFGIGVLLEAHREGRVGSGEALGGSLALAAVSAWTLGPASAVAGLFTAAMIAGFTYVPGPAAWVGRISYSLYLLHEMVGMVSEAALKRVFPDPGAGGKIVLLLVYTLLAVLGSAAFYALVEAPALRLSRRLRLARRPPPSVS